MKNLITFEDFLNESQRHAIFENKIEPHQKDMYDGIVDILKRVKDLKNRTEIAEHMLKDFKKENINVDEMTFMKDCGIVDSKGNYLTT